MRNVMKVLVPLWWILLVSIILLSFTQFFAFLGISVATFFLVFYLLILLGQIFAIWMIVDCAMRKMENKFLWLIFIIFTTFVGATFYFYYHGNRGLNKTKK